jgi:hypothetical protein
MRTIPLLAVGLFTAALILTLFSGFLELSEVNGLIPRIPNPSDPGHDVGSGWTRDGVLHHLDTPRHRLHKTASHWVVVLAWPAIPGGTLAALMAAWPRIKHKKLATFFVAISILGCFAFLLLSSFVGSLISLQSAVPRDGSGLTLPPSASYIRMLALHCFGFPFLELVAVGATWIILIRLFLRGKAPADSAETTG